MKLKISVDESVFERFPSFVRSIVVATEIENKSSSPELKELLDNAVSQLYEKPIDLNIDERISVWKDAYKSLGVSPKKFPPAHFALLKRIQKKQGSFPFINKVVAIMNYNSITGVLPVGGDDLKSAGCHLMLKPAHGNEHFTSLSSPDIVENPDAGEIIYVVEESSEIMCRRWNWRNGYKTRITENTSAIAMNIEGLGINSQSRAEETRNNVAEMLARHCGATVRTISLTPSQPETELSLDI